MGMDVVVTMLKSDAVVLKTDGLGRVQSADGTAGKPVR
jgi:hypothetical protein